MSEDAIGSSLTPLPPRLASVFRALRSGRHLSRDDGPDFLDLDRNFESYAHVLHGLGYSLRRHGQGFFYIEGTVGVRSDRMRASLLFMLILFQDLDEKKFERQDRAWERSLLRTTFKIAELPHFQTSHRRSMMSAVGVEESGLSRVLQFLERLGVVRLLPESQFSFKSPVHRFVELCVRFAEEQNWAQSTAASVAPSAQMTDEPDDEEEGEA